MPKAIWTISSFIYFTGNIYLQNSIASFYIRWITVSLSKLKYGRRPTNKLDKLGSDLIPTYLFIFRKPNIFGGLFFFNFAITTTFFIIKYYMKCKKSWNKEYVTFYVLHKKMKKNTFKKVKNGESLWSIYEPFHPDFINTLVQDISWKYIGLNIKSSLKNLLLYIN